MAALKRQTQPEQAPISCAMKTPAQGTSRSLCSDEHTARDAPAYFASEICASSFLKLTSSGTNFGHIAHTSYVIYYYARNYMHNSRLSTSWPSCDTRSSLTMSHPVTSAIVAFIIDDDITVTLTCGVDDPPVTVGPSGPCVIVCDAAVVGAADEAAAVVCSETTRFTKATNRQNTRWNYKLHQY